MNVAWIYDDGDWEQFDNPIPELTQEAIKEFGYTSTPTAIFGTSDETPGFTIEVYPRQHDDDRFPYDFLVLVPSLTSQPIFVTDLPSALDLLGQLVPLVGAASS